MANIDMLYLCAGGRGAMIFSYDKSTSLEGGGGVRKKNPEMIRGGFKGKNKEIIIAHPLDKLRMLPKQVKGLQVNKHSTSASMHAVSAGGK